MIFAYSTGITIILFFLGMDFGSSTHDLFIDCLVTKNNTEILMAYFKMFCFLFIWSVMNSTISNMTFKIRKHFEEITFFKSNTQNKRFKLSSVKL